MTLTLKKDSQRSRSLRAPIRGTTGKRTNNATTKTTTTNRNDIGVGVRISWCPRLQKLFIFFGIIWLIYLISFVDMAVKVHRLDREQNSYDQHKKDRQHGISNKRQHRQSLDGSTEKNRRDKAMTPNQLFDKQQSRAKELHDKIQKLREKEQERGTLTTKEQQEEFNSLSELLHGKVEDDHGKEEDVANPGPKKLQVNVRKHDNEKFNNPQTESQNGFMTNAAQPNNNNNDQEKGKNGKRSKQKPRKKRPGWKAKPYGYMVNPENLFDDNNMNSQDREQKQLQRDEQRAARAVIPDHQVLAAYIEPPLDSETWWEEKPLPIRNVSAKDLKKITFRQLNSCFDLPEQFPVDDTPTNDDPYLPWIHDVFPTHDGKYIQFVAQNKLRCRTGTTDSEEEALEFMAPQVSLFQHVPLKRIDTTTNFSLPSSSSPFLRGGDSPSSPPPRFRLSSHEEADMESMATRFICRFKPSGDITFSEFNNDYEWVSYRKMGKLMFNEDGRDNQQIHTSQLLFRCPVPERLIPIVKDGSSVVNDWATIFVDLITVRTPPRYLPPESFLVPYFKRSVTGRITTPEFEPDVEWGKHHILPALDDSGRWENIPICKPSLMTYQPEEMKKFAADPKNNDKEANERENDVSEVPNKTYKLVSCLWASSGYSTRGNRFAINDGQRRLVEWITFNKLLGFDHFYLYDNSAAFSNETSLQPIVDRFFPDDVTVIKWPSKVCNNNPNNVDSRGERSSQYAAESSCRLRFGPHVEWIGQFDIDEYLVPMGSHTSIHPILDKLDEEGKKIINFASWRAWPRRTYINEPVNVVSQELCHHPRRKCFQLSVPSNVTMLQAYNCDRQRPGQKVDQMPAEKQIYKADYVTQHFIHYSTVTRTTNLPFDEYFKLYGNKRPFPDPLSRFGNEVEEALMLHSKAIAIPDTTSWIENCHKNFSSYDQCRIGFPYPDDEDEASLKEKNMRLYDSSGWEYNCFVNPRIDFFWVPQLEAKLAEMGILQK